MRRGTKTAAALAGVVLAGAILYLVDTLVALDAFRSITPRFAGSCIRVAGVVGAEDIAIDRQADVAYLSATDRHAREGAPSSRGGRDGIYRFPLRGESADLAAALAAGKRTFDGDAGLRYLPVEGVDDFHPHGIDLHHLPDGGLLLFAVNHDRSGSSVEVLRVESDHLVHLETVRDPTIFTPNDVLALSPRSFYVTNDRAQPRVGGARQLMRDVFLRNSPTTVVYWDGASARPAATDVKGANGIAASLDGRRIYVAASLGNDLLIFDRSERNQLTLADTIPLGSSPDNLAIAPDGRILVAAHPSLWKILMARTKMPWDPIPSQVIEVLPSKSGEHWVKEIYMNRGDEISNVTVAAPYDAKLFLMGTAYDEGVWVCRRD